jgi:hypothetical protein
MNEKLKQIANEALKDITTKDDYEFFMSFADKYGMLILKECIDAVTEKEYPNAYGELTGVKAIENRFNLKG